MVSLLRQFRVPRAPQLNISATWLLVLPCLMLGTWLLATMTTTAVAPSFRVKAVTPKWNKEKGEGFVGHNAIRHLVAIHYKDNEHTTIDFCDHETMPFPYATIQYKTSYRNYNASFRMLLHHPETDYGISGSLFNGNGAYEWKSHLKKIMTNFMDELQDRTDLTNRIVVDIGANIGSTALWLAALGYQVHAIEPAARNFALMHCSYVINPTLHSYLWLSNVGMSDREQSGICMKYSQGSKAEAFIQTGRMPYEEEYYGSYEDEQASAPEAEETKLEAEMAQEAEENKQLLEEDQSTQGSGRRLLQSRRRMLDTSKQDVTQEAIDEELTEIEEEIKEEQAGMAQQEEAELAQEAAHQHALEEATLADAAGRDDPSVGDAIDEYAYGDGTFDVSFPADCDEEDVNLITLDWYWEKKLRKEQITLLKVDVEGYEHKVLQGGSRLFAEKPPLYVLMEVHPSAMRAYSGDPKTLYQSIRDMGYFLIAVDGVEIQQDSWEMLVGQEGHLFDTLWVRKQPEGKFEWGLDYYLDYAYDPQEAASAGEEQTP